MERMTAAELMAADIGERQYAVHELIPLGGVTVISAKKGRGKSVLTFRMSDCVSRGRDFIGRPTRQGQVLYIGTEDDEIELRRRYSLMLRSSGDEPSANLDVVDEWPKAREGGVDKVVEWCEACDNPVMVVIDVLAHVVPELITVRGGWANVLKAMTPWIKMARQYSIAVVFVVHNYRGGDFVPNPIERIQGSGGLTAYAQCVLVIQGSPGETERQLDYAGKHGTGQLALTIDGPTMTCTLRDAPPEQAQSDQSAQRARLAKVVQLFPGLKARQIATLPQLKDRTVFATERLLELMAQDGQLRKDNRRYFDPEAAAVAELRPASEEQRVS